MKNTLLSLARAFLAFILSAQSAAAVMLQAPVRLQSQAPAIGAIIPGTSVVGPSTLSLSAPASLLPSLSSLPAAPAPSVSASPLLAAPPTVLGPVAGRMDSAVQDLSRTWSRGDVAATRGLLGTHFDGSALLPAAPEDAAQPVQAAPAAAGEIPFHGLRLPAAQFSEEGPGWMSTKLIAAIDATRDTLDLALLEVMHAQLAEAVLRAHARGVKVRIVMDSMHVYPEKPNQHRSDEIQKFLDAGIPMLMLRGRDKYGLMHNKFAVMDGQVVWSGSANWSRAADNVHQENSTYTDDPHRLAGFQKVWDWMWSISKPYGEPAGRADGRVPPQDAQQPVKFHGQSLPAYAFAPGDAAEGFLLKAIRASQRTLDIAMFSCTSGKIKEALLEARSRGVKVRIVFDKAQFRYLPPMMWFVDNGFEVLLGEGFRPGKSAMHHKFVIFDGELVQNGSYNWTDGAKFNNFENVQFWTDPAMLAAYVAGYERLLGRSSPVTDEDIEANKAAAAGRAKEDAARPAAPPQKPGGGKLTRRDAPIFGSRRLALSPFRRGLGAGRLAASS
jgi:phosphatidylserine/phosphatidylglycerophosphate/cardiolipin synthase-like enzyme